MKIQLFDAWSGKFSSSIRDHWISLGHEVLFNQQYKLDEPADIAFFYTADNSTQVGVKECNAKKIYVQAVDIEIWGGQPDGIDWSKVEGCVTMAQHTSEMVKTPPNVKRAIIKPGIDTAKFTLASPDRFSDPIRRIAYVVGDNRIWDVKRFDIALQLLYDIRKLRPELIWQLHVRGTYSSHVQYNAYCNHLIKELDLEDFIVWDERVDDMNKYLDDKHFFVLPSTKEVFSYATAEAMAKGIKPVIGNWQSARETWEPFVNNSYMEMLEKLCTDTTNYEAEFYRKYVTDNYSQERYFRQLDEAFEIGGEV